MAHEVAVIGAGPYGLSIAAHIPFADPVVFGDPMESWRAMPEHMYLKSVWSASSLADPAASYSLDRYAAEQGQTPGEPISLDFFVAYGEWFQRHAVPTVDRTYVACLRHAGSGFDIGLADGRRMSAQTVVVATGIRAFAQVPEFARDLPGHLASHTGDHRCLAGFKGQRVAVLGAGQSALETAAMLHEEGALPEIITRKPVIWIKRVLYGHDSVISKLLYPPTDVGPPGLNWLCAAPLLMQRLPTGVRRKIELRAVRAAGAQWLRPRVEGSIPVSEGVEIVTVTPAGDCLRLGLSDGTSREVDHLMLGTGYRPDIAKLPFIDPDLCGRITQRDGFPVLNEWFESSVPGLHIVGGLAGRTFGPICRFVAGARITARQVARRIADLN